MSRLPSRKGSPDFSVTANSIWPLSGAGGETGPKPPTPMANGQKGKGSYLLRLRQIKPNMAPHTSKVMLPGSGILAMRVPI